MGLSVSAQGRAIAESGQATAMIDVSDGLLMDVHRLADASRVGFRIRAEDIPVHADARNGAGGGLGAALTEGEDFELLFACAKHPREVTAILRQAGLRSRMTAIGRAVAQPGITFMERDVPVSITADRFQHFPT